MTLEEKKEAYRKGAYSFTPPPVGHYSWNVYDWINYIDKCGRWHERT